MGTATSATRSAFPPSAASDRAALRGQRAAVLLFAYYPFDARPRRAAELLAREGMDVELICLRESRQEPARDTVNGVTIRRLPIKRRRGGVVAYLAQYAAFVVATFAILAVRSLRRRFALVHVHNMPDVLVFSALVPRLLGAKVILDVHDPMPELMRTIFGLRPSSRSVRLLERLERWSVRHADLVVTVNLICRKLLVSRGCPPAKVQVVMNSPDDRVFELRPPMTAPLGATRPFVLMYHGSIVERNGLDLAVEALALVRPTIPQAELRIYAHDSPFLARVMDTVDRLGLRGAVRFLGPRPPEGIVAAIDECDLGVVPNRRSVFTELNTPTRIFEYLARGKPVVAGRAPGVRDYFEEDALLFFELGDARDLARVITHVFSHPELLEQTVRRGQEVYLAHRWSAEGGALLRRVESLLGAAA